MVLDNQELQRLVEELSLDYFQKPFCHQAFFNLRLKTTGGRYLLESHNIELNKRYYEEFGINELIGIIKHELCHYHLHLEGKGYKHRDQDFKALLKKVGAPRYCSPLPETIEKRKQRKTLTYICVDCQQVYIRRRKIDTDKYVCSHCYGKLSLKK